MKAWTERGLNRNRSMAGAKLLTGNSLLACGLAAIVLVLAPNMLAAVPGANPAKPQANSDAKMVQYKSGDDNISAYLAKPKGEGKHAAVLVVHDIAGVDDRLQDVARRFADAGFVALAPNLVSRSTTAKTPQQITTAISQLSLVRPVDDLKAALAFLQQDPSVDAAKISVVAFGWGGWRAFKMAETSPSLYRMVIFYGTTPGDDDALTNVKIPVLANYAQYDFRVTANSLLTKKKLGSTFTYYVYNGADRGFLMPDPQPPSGFEGSGPEAAANTEAAKLSWTRTLEFLKKS